MPGSWPAGRRKRSSAARSGSSARRPSARPPGAASGSSTCSAGCSPSPPSAASSRCSRSACWAATTAAAGYPSGPSDAASSVELPEQKTGDLKAAAKAAGCTLDNPEIEGSTHEDKDFKASDYKTNPPTSGNHNPDWYEDGIYNAGDTPKLGMLVHTLEHGRIDVQYKEGTSPDDVAKLEAFLGETDGYHMLLFQNTTGMDAAVAATAWGHSLTCAKLDDTTWDALRTFRTTYIDKGPEAVP